MKNLFVIAALLFWPMTGGAVTLSYSGANYEIVENNQGPECGSSCRFYLPTGFDEQMRLSAELGFKGQLPKNATIEVEDFRSGRVFLKTLDGYTKILKNISLRYIVISSGIFSTDEPNFTLTLQTDGDRNIIDWHLWALLFGSSVDIHEVTSSLNGGDRVFHGWEYDVANCESSCERYQTFKARTTSSGSWTVSRGKPQTVAAVPLQGSLGFSLIALSIVLLLRSRSPREV